MSVFADPDELKHVMVSLWQRIKNDPGMSAQLLRSRLIVQFRYRDPEGILTIDASDGQEIKIEWGPTSTKPVIEMAMKADVANDFWMGRITIPVAILTGKIVSRGPTPIALAMLPVIRPAFQIYPEIMSDLSSTLAGRH